MNSWLTDELKEKVGNTFKQYYKKPLKDDEVKEIAVNLTDFMEGYIKFKLRQKYENLKNLP